MPWPQSVDELGFSQAFPPIVLFLILTFGLSIVLGNPFLFNLSGFVLVHPPFLFLAISPRITIFEDIRISYGKRKNREIEDDAVAKVFQRLKGDRARRHSDLSAAGKGF